jgi:hypothetical protein
MRIYFLTSSDTDIAVQDTTFVDDIKKYIEDSTDHEVAADVQSADAIVLQESYSYKTPRYIKRLKQDTVIGRYADKIYTINIDDWATGLLKGIYTSLPKRRYQKQIHRLGPYSSFPNEAVLQRRNDPRQSPPSYLATWRGNIKSNPSLRKKLVSRYANASGFKVETTDSWANHGKDEKDHYVDLLLSGRFSLCPAGWAPVSYRIYESMALGVCPVILADEFVEPEGPNWKEISLRISEKDVPHLGKILQEHSSSYLELGDNARSAWETYFSPEKAAEYYADALLSCMDSNLASATISNEMARWNSFDMHWNNRWTFPQRLAVKVRHLLTR